MSARLAFKREEAILFLSFRTFARDLMSASYLLRTASLYYWQYRVNEFPISVLLAVTEHPEVAPDSALGMKWVVSIERVVTSFQIGPPHGSCPHRNRVAFRAVSLS